MTRSKLSYALDVVLVLCAMTTTVAFIEWHGRPTAPPVDTGMHRFTGWQQDLAFDRRIGPPNAPYQLVVWTDYQCPACKQFELELAHVKQKLKDSLSVVYRYNPLAMHPLAFPAAIAAECARSQGKFAEMHAALFSTTLVGDTLPIDSLLARSQISRPQAFRACLRDSTTIRTVEVDMARSKALQLRGTPALQVGDRIGIGGLLADDLLQLLYSEHK